MSKCYICCERGSVYSGMCAECRKEKELREQAEHEEHVKAVRQQLLEKAIEKSKRFDWVATSIVTIDIVVLVNSQNARNFEKWMAISGLTRISRQSLHTNRIHQLVSDYGSFRAQTKFDTPTQSTIQDYLRCTLVRNFDETKFLNEKIVQRGYFVRSFWRNPFEVDFNND